MTNLKVTILPGGITAREVNPFGEKDQFGRCTGWWPNYGRYGTYDQYERKWQEAEDKCRVFTIDISHLNLLDYVKNAWSGYEEGSTHSAEIIDEEKLIIKIL